MTTLGGSPEAGGVKGNQVCRVRVYSSASAARLRAAQHGYELVPVTAVRQIYDVYRSYFVTGIRVNTSPLILPRGYTCHHRCAIHLAVAGAGREDERAQHDGQYAQHGRKQCGELHGFQHTRILLVTKTSRHTITRL